MLDVLLVVPCSLLTLCAGKSYQICFSPERQGSHLHARPGSPSAQLIARDLHACDAWQDANGSIWRLEFARGLRGFVVDTRLFEQQPHCVPTSDEHNQSLVAVVRGKPQAKLKPLDMNSFMAAVEARGAVSAVALFQTQECYLVFRFRQATLRTMAIRVSATLLNSLVSRYPTRHPGEMQTSSTG